MNRNEAIEKSAQLFLQVLEHNDNRLTDSVFDSINGLREALALPEDAEREYLIECLMYSIKYYGLRPVHLELLKRIQTYLQGGA